MAKKKKSQVKNHTQGARKNKIPTVAADDLHLENARQIVSDCINRGESTEEKIEAAFREAGIKPKALPEDFLPELRKGINKFLKALEIVIKSARK